MQEADVPFIAEEQKFLKCLDSEWKDYYIIEYDMKEKPFGMDLKSINTHPYFWIQIKISDLWYLLRWDEPQHGKQMENGNNIGHLFKTWLIEIDTKNASQTDQNYFLIAGCSYQF